MATTTTATIEIDGDYSAYDSDSGERLDEPPTTELVAASLAAGAEGHVMAALVRGQWEHVTPGDVEAARDRGEAVRRVYVVAD